jgi:hypothetical protein
MIFAFSPFAVFAQVDTGTSTPQLPFIPTLNFPTQQEIENQVSNLLGNQLSIVLSPGRPRPNQVITASAESFSMDLNSATLTWRRDGTVIAQGSGITEVTFQVGDAGSQSTLSVSASGNEAFQSRQIIIRPAAVDLMYEAESYTPPLYKGKALPGSQTPLRVLALPHIVRSGRTLNASELDFAWKIDGRVLGTQSGRGQDSISIEGPRLFNPITVDLTVSTLDGDPAARGFLEIGAVEPHLLFYENDPVLGIRYEQALANPFLLTNEEVTITAHPFYFSGTNRTNAASRFRWTLNGRVVTNPLQDQSSIVLRQTDAAASGSATIALSIQNADRVLQRAQNSFRIQFGDQNE